MRFLTVTPRRRHKGKTRRSARSGTTVASCGAVVGLYYVLPEKLIRTQLRHGFGRPCKRCYKHPPRVGRSPVTPVTTQHGHTIGG
jgi:hypothetical protein